MHPSLLVNFDYNIGAGTGTQSAANTFALVNTGCGTITLTVEVAGNDDNLFRAYFGTKRTSFTAFLEKYGLGQ